MGGIMVEGKERAGAAPRGPSLSLVIATYNRAGLVGRAIESGLDQGYPGLEIIVVDDASTDATSDVIPTRYPDVRYFRQPHNQGPGPARNRGIQVTGGEWVVVLDDDDFLVRGALGHIAEKVMSLPGSPPVVQFARSNGRIPREFMVLRLEDYLLGVLEGDFTPVIHRERFLAAGLAYPCVRIGAEHLLWFQIAKRYGIPTWNTRVTRLGVDAPDRITGCRRRIRRAADYARMQEMTLEVFPEIEAAFPCYARRKHRAALAYWLLVGERGLARSHLRHPNRTLLDAVVLRGFSRLPAWAVRLLFLLYCSRSQDD